MDQGPPEPRSPVRAAPPLRDEERLRRAHELNDLLTVITGRSHMLLAHLAEDDDEVREMTADIPGKAGYTVLSATNGTRARELARRLKPLRPGMRVLSVSGYVRDEAARAAIAGEDAAFLPRPFTPTALVAAVSGLLVPRP